MEGSAQVAGVGAVGAALVPLLDEALMPPLPGCQLPMVLSWSFSGSRLWPRL